VQTSGQEVVGLTITFRGEEEDFAVARLPHADARALMLEIAGAGLAQRPGFDALLEYLDGYTLAIELAAVFLARFGDYTPHDYLRDLRSSRGRELQARVEARTSYQRTLDDALRMLWNRLPPRIRSAWQLAAAFASAPIRRARASRAGLVGRDLASLADAHIVEVQRDGSWTMHPLMRRFARDRSGHAAVPEHDRALVSGCPALVAARPNPALGLGPAAGRSTAN